MKRVSGVRPLGVVHKVAAGLSAASFLLIGVFVLSFGALPLKYTILAIVGALVISVLLIVLNIRAHGDHIVRSVILLVATLIWAVVCAFGAKYIHTTTSFLDSLSVDTKEYREYSLIAKKSHADGVKSVEGERMGLLKNDPNYQKIVDIMAEQVSTKNVDVDELSAATVSISDGGLDALVLPSAYMTLLSEDHKIFYDEVKVIYTFKIEIEATETADVDVEKPFILYISGLDTYGAVDTVSRSDVNMLMVFNPKEHKALLVNTPRDFYVQLHGTTGMKDKLTHAGIYGVEMSKATLEDLYGVKIGYYVKINFESLIKIIDTIGDIDVYSDYEFTARDGGYAYHQGVNRLGSAQALAFARERYAFADGDNQRGKNQQKVIEAVFNKLQSPAIITKYQSLLSALSGAFSTNASKDDINTIIKQQIDSAGKWKVESISVTGAGASQPTYSMGSQLLYVMVPDKGSVSAAKSKIEQYLAD